MPRITKRLVDTLKPEPDRDLFVWDDGVRGFGLRITPGGSRAFIVQYRTAEGRTRRLAFAKVGTLTVEEARATAQLKLADVVKGQDPSADRHARRDAMTVADVCEWYMREATAGRLLGRLNRPIKASTLAMDRSRIDRHVLPLLGRRTVDGLDDREIARFQMRVAAGDTAKERGNRRGGETTGGAGVAARTVRMLRAILEHARREKLVTSNPAAGVRQLAEGRVDRRMSEEEIGRLGAALRALEAAGGVTTATAAIKFLLLTGMRRGEALSLRWSDVDPASRTVSLADTKSGQQIRPIGEAALHLLQTLSRRGDYVFPAVRGGGHFVGLPKVLSGVMEAAGIEGVTVHGLRHAFASVAADEGFSEMTIAALLGHARKGVTQRYAKVDRAAVLAADVVSGKLAALLDGRKAA